MAKILPKVYFGLHMAPGVAEYRDPGKEPYRILIQEDAIKEMDGTFPGRPLYVNHVDEVIMDNLHEADGYVVESFYNKADGKHWAKFIVTTDKGHEAIRSGWKLSNAYHMKNFRGGGQWHGVDYLKEVTQGEYEHLAIVPNPRYSESVILTPEEFHSYNKQKDVELEIKRMSNSKEKETEKTKGALSMLNFFKREKVENSADLEGMSVVLPKTKREVSILTLINEADIDETKHLVNGEGRVKAGDEEMSVNELVEKYNSMCAAKKQNDEDMAKKKENEEDPDKKENEEEKPEDKKENGDEDKEDEKAKNALENFKKLKNAPETFTNSVVHETSEDKITRGRSRYGS